MFEGMYPPWLTAILIAALALLVAILIIRWLS